MSYYNVKILESLSYIEVWKNELPTKQGYEELRKTEAKRRTYEELSASEKIDSLQKRKKYYLEKKQEIRRLVDCNFDSSSSFLTLTQRNDSIIQDDIDIGNREFQNFLKRLKRYLKKYHPERVLKYIATWELTKAGKIHYHIILFSFPYVPAKEIERLWTHGFIKINQIDKVKREVVGLYISKYFTKDLDMKTAKKKSYFTSRNLIKPLEYKFYVPKDFNIENYGSPSYEKEYTVKKWRPEGFIESKSEYYFIPKTNLDSPNKEEKIDESLNKNAGRNGR